jgi:hypothetical protein
VAAFRKVWVEEVEDAPRMLWCTSWSISCWRRISAISGSDAEATTLSSAASSDSSSLGISAGLAGLRLAARESALRKEVAPAYTVEVTDDSRLRLVTAN